MNNWQFTCEEKAIIVLVIAIVLLILGALFLSESADSQAGSFQVSTPTNTPRPTLPTTPSPVYKNLVPLVLKDSTPTPTHIPRPTLPRSN